VQPSLEVSRNPTTPPRTCTGRALLAGLGSAARCIHTRFLAPAIPERSTIPTTMPMPPLKVSVVIPVHNAQHRLASEISRVLDALADLSRQRCELIIVDELVKRFPQVQVLRHPSPRGIEAAAETGLQAASGEIVFIQENNQPIRLEDMRRLFRMSEDPSIVAARAQSTPRPLSAALQRQLAGNRGATAEPLSITAAPDTPGLQMIRRPHLQQLRGPMAAGITLRSEVFDLTATG
jgi:hypothetical protein